MVSVIIPVYNNEDFIKECIESLLSQDFDDYELIFVDDGSSDSSLNIINSFNDKRIFVYSTRHVGPAGARNLGFNKSHGDYITFVDGDDYVSSNYLSSLYSQMKENLKSISITSFTRDENVNINNNGKIRFKHLSRNDALKKLFNDKCIYSQCWGKMYSREIIENELFPEGVFFEDIRVVVRWLTLAEEITYSNTKTYFYRKNKNGIMQTKFSEKKINDLKDVNKILINNYQEFRTVYNRIFINNLLLVKHTTIENDNQITEEILFIKRKALKMLFTNLPLRIKFAGLLVIINYNLLR